MATNPRTEARTDWWARFLKVIVSYIATLRRPTAPPQILWPDTASGTKSWNPLRGGAHGLLARRDRPGDERGAGAEGRARLPRALGHAGARAGHSRLARAARG